MGSVLRGMKRGIRLQVIVLAMTGMTIDVFSNPFTADLVFQRIYSALDLPDTDPESDDGAARDIGALAAAESSSRTTRQRCPPMRRFGSSPSRVALSRAHGRALAR